MQTEELETLLRDLESDRVERKESGKDRKEIRRAICAFANDLADRRKPGVIFLGVNDAGAGVGLDITDDLLCTLAAMRSSGNILPMPVLSVEKRALCGHDVIVIEVEPAAYPPVRDDGRTWVRVGPTRRLATVEEEGRLAEKRRRGTVSFDQQPVPSATIDDLDLRVFEEDYLPNAVAPETLAANRRTPMQQLTSLNFATPQGEPTVAGLLLFGKDVGRWLPGAYVQFVRFAGSGLGDPITDQKRIDGRLADVLRRLDDVLGAHIHEALDIQGAPTEERRPDYPTEALRQLVRNAIMHRTYEHSNAPVRLYWFEERIEIHNPGGPFGQVTPENLGAPSLTDYRNLVPAVAMRVLGYVQSFGVGIALAREALEANGNPALMFEANPSHVLATIRRRE